MVKNIYCLEKYLFDEELFSLLPNSSLRNVYDIEKLKGPEMSKAIQKLSDFSGFSVEENTLFVEKREAYFEQNLDDWDSFRQEADMSPYVSNYIPEATPILTDYDALVTQLTAELGVLTNKYGHYVVFKNMLLNINNFLLSYAINGSKYEIKSVYEFEY